MHKVNNNTLASVSLLPSHLLSLHPLWHSLNIVLHSQVNKLVLRFSLNHTRSLWPNHLYCTLNVNLTVKPLPLNLVQDHVNNNEGACATNTSWAVNEHWASICNRLLLCIYIMQEVQNTSRIWRHTMVWPCLEKYDIHIYWNNSVELHMKCVRNAESCYKVNKQLK